MVYEENSFLMGITVGRAMKGVSVQKPGTDATVKSSAGFQLGQMIQDSIQAASDIYGVVSVASYAIGIEGKELTGDVSAPADSGIGSLTPQATVSPTPFDYFASDTVPAQMDGAPSAAAVITIDE